MWQVGVWEPEGSLSPLLAQLTQGVPCFIRACSARCPHWSVELDVLVVAPHAPCPLCLPPCAHALVPGDVPPPQFALPPAAVVSYGCASRDTLTLSSLSHTRASVAVQREFPRLGDGMVERQELVLPYTGPDPMAFLAQVGTALLLGLEPGDSGLYVPETM